MRNLEMEMFKKPIKILKKMETKCPIRIEKGITEIEIGLVTALLITGLQKSTYKGKILQAIELRLSCEQKIRK